MWFRPNRVLALLLFMELIIFVVFIGWEFVWPNFLGYTAPALDAQKWILLITMFSAISGWIITAMVNVRNSIKQHTINVLLQSRLSATYMSHADVINKNFISSDGDPKPLSPCELESQEEDTRKKLDSIRYILNYIEFISVGIKHGDLNESLLKSSLRTIVLNAAKISAAYIEHQRKVNNRAYINMIWLRDRWNK